MSETLCENCQLAHASRNYLSICNPSVVILKGSDLQARKSRPLSLPKPINLSLLAQPIPREPQEFSKQCRDQNGFTCLRDLPHILHSDYPVIPSDTQRISQDQPTSGHQATCGEATTEKSCDAIAANHRPCRRTIHGPSSAVDNDPSRHLNIFKTYLKLFKNAREMNLFKLGANN